AARPVRAAARRGHAGRVRGGRVAAGGRRLPAADRVLSRTGRALIRIVSYPNYAHVERVVEHLTRPYALFDTGWYPARSLLTVAVKECCESLALTTADGEVIDLARVGAVWHRRISPMTFDESLTDPTGRLFAWSEANEALLGLWYSLHCYWMNPPWADEVGQRKVRQLQLARSLGLPVPETLITNDPARARDFVASHAPGGVVRKAFRNIAEAPRETSVVSEADLRLIDTVRFAPVIFQRFVPADLDLRVTYVDGELFPAAIRSRPEYQTDYRLGVGHAQVLPYELPDDVAARLRCLMDALDLRFGGIDMRVTPEGEHVFLEVNPAGEYLFVTERTGQPVPQAIAAALEQHDREWGA